MPTYKFPRPAMTVDIVLFGVEIEGPQEGLHVLLIKRKEPPFKDHEALPGGFVGINMGESLDDAAFRELREETAVKPAYLEQLYTFGSPKRDPRERVVSVAYFALVAGAKHTPKAGSDAKEARWHRIVPVGPNFFFADESMTHARLAFDHDVIIKKAVERLKSKIMYAPIGFDLLPAEFTMPELQKLYEIILGRSIDKGNFRRKMRDLGILGLTNKTKNVGGRKLDLYCFDKQRYDMAAQRGINFEV
jgi:8-oxo-dGTP diphosphatase